MKERRESSSSIATLGVGLGLVLLAGASYALSFVALGAWALPIALCIAALKAGLVVFMFMELYRETASIQLAALAAVLMLLLLVTLTAADVATRGTPVVTAPVYR
jgi:cytochrome c oxidase subunit 4